jgi:SNF2 family DNA or RNA helicase
MSDGRSVGKAWLEGGLWYIESEPHIAMRLKRTLERIDKSKHGVLTLTNTPENCRELEWFCQRFFIDFDAKDRAALTGGASQHRDHILSLEQIVGGTYRPRAFKMALPARTYQAQFAEILLRQKFLLNGDDLGLGKTCAAICSMTDSRTLPALVVCHPFLQSQWQAELAKFAPSLKSHVIRSGTPYPLPRIHGNTPDVLITTYHKLNGWAGTLGGHCRSIHFDEVQELRHAGSLKYAGAKHIAGKAEWRAGYSATPIFNFGGEMFNVMNILCPGVLGTHEEFTREWCTSLSNGKWRINEPQAFGTYLRENFLMLRRTREEVGRELPEVTRVPHRIDADSAELAKVEGRAAELADIILNRKESYDGEKMNANAQLDNLIRQATGIAKAAYVAEFVNMLVESGERVLLAGWHRAVYDIWRSHFDHAKTSYVMFTGTESAGTKERAKELFVKGDAQVMIISLRSGAGLDGLQGVCNVVVIAELDWSPAVMDQVIGRVHRDGQQRNVTAYFLLSEEGSDPLMAEVLGLKRAQIDGIRSPTRNLVEKLDVGGVQSKRLAEHFLKKNRGENGCAPKEYVRPIAAAPVIVPVVPVRKVRMVMARLPV